MRRIVVFAAVGTVVLLLIGLVGEDLRTHLDAFDAWLSSLGPMAMVAYLVLLVIGTTILLPESIFGILGGMLFGVLLGNLLALAGNVAAACLQYSLARRFLPGIALRIMNSHPMLARFDKVIGSAGFRLQALVRLTPLNPAALSFVLGAHGVSLASFMAASLFSFPHVFAEVYFGYVGSHALRRVSGSAPEATILHDILLGAGLLATIAALTVISRLASRALDRAETKISSTRGTS